MQIKPTYESLEKQVAELKKQVETLQSSAVISEHKQTEVLLEESERKYRQLFTEMVSGAALYEIICDENGKPVDFVTLEINRAFESLLGVRREELIGKKFSEISSAENTAVWIEMFGKVALTGESTTYERYASGNNQYFEGAVYSPQHPAQ